ncbi:MAG: trypsin-like peptidase domain-containing protein [Planctomycetaceae bacterium]
MRTLAAVLLVVVPSVCQAADDVVLLDFTAPYCGPCKTIQPQLDNLRRQGYPIRQVDISRDPAMSRQFGVSFVPTFVLLVNGKEQWRDAGTERVGDLKGIMDRAMRQVAKTKPAPVAKKSGDAKGTLFDRLFNRDKKSEPAEPTVVLGQQPERVPDSVANGAMAASVRIRVTYDGKVQFGSGTIVHSQRGRSIILTCAHIMDQAGPNPKVQVDVFLNGKSKTFHGKVVGHDINPDVGLITIPTSMKLPIAEVVPPTQKPEKGQSVFSIGCNNGKEPTREGARLSGVDSYDGPNNLETNHAPEHGRSGGALFDSAGRVIGVCSAADRKGNHGLYAGNRAIFTMLKKYNMLEVYAQGNPVLAADRSDRQRLFASNDGFGSTGFLQEITDVPGIKDSVGALGAPESGFGEVGRTDDEFAMSDASAFDQSVEGSFETVENNVGIGETIHEIPYALNGANLQQRANEMGAGAEVTIVIRPRNSDQASKIVVIPKASSRFIAMLQGEVESKPVRTTSLTRPVHERHLTSMTQVAPEPSSSRSVRHRQMIRSCYPVSKWIERGETSDVPKALTGWTTAGR